MLVVVHACQEKKRTWLKNKKHKNNQKCVDKLAVFAIFPLSPLTALQLQPIEKKQYVIDHRKKQSERRTTHGR
jgi:hypothetical protein